MKLYLLSFLLFLFPFPEIYFAKAVGITASDSIIILSKEISTIKIRLRGIVCPVNYKDSDQKATQATYNLCFNKQVCSEKSGFALNDHTQDFVYADDICVDNATLKQGLAWYYKKYNQDPKEANLDDKARSKKIGIWSLSSPTPSWGFIKNT